MPPAKMPGIGRGNNPNSRKNLIPFAPKNTIIEKVKSAIELNAVELAQARRFSRSAGKRARALYERQVANYQDKALKGLARMATRLGYRETELYDAYQKVSFDEIEQIIADSDTTWERVFSDSPTEWQSPYSMDDIQNEDGKSEEVIDAIIELARSR